jgi:hypothetical protein
MNNWAIIIKFGLKEQLVELQKGHLYFNTIKYFKQADETNAGRLDIFENINAYMPYAKINVYPHKSMQKLLHTNFVHDVAITHGEHANRFSHIWSCFHLKNGMPVRQDNKIFSDSMWEFGDHILLIHNVNKFFERIDNVLANIAFARDSVTYVDKQQPQINTMNTFTKFNTFQYQNEYRVAIKDYSDIQYGLKIGSIKDISLLQHKFEVKNLVQMTTDKLGMLHILHF